MAPFILQNPRADTKWMMFARAIAIRHPTVPPGGLIRGDDHDMQRKQERY